MDVRIILMNGSVTMDATILKGLTRSSDLMQQYSEQDKDLIMLAKDERFPKTVTKPKDAESSGDDSVVNAGK